MFALPRVEVHPFVGFSKKSREIAGFIDAAYRLDTTEVCRWGSRRGNVSVCRFLRRHDRYRAVAQLGSAPALGAGGRQFKSDQPDRNANDVPEEFASQLLGNSVPSGTPWELIAAFLGSHCGGDESSHSCAGRPLDTDQLRYKPVPQSWVDATRGSWPGGECRWR
jgi:hypothetical protein